MLKNFIGGAYLSHVHSIRPRILRKEKPQSSIVVAAGSELERVSSQPLSVDTDAWVKPGTHKDSQLTDTELSAQKGVNDAETAHKGWYNSEALRVPSPSEVKGFYGNNDDVLRHGRQDTIAEACTTCKWASESMTEAFHTCWANFGRAEYGLCDAGGKEENLRACWAKMAGEPQGVGWKRYYLNKYLLTIIKATLKVKKVFRRVLRVLRHRRGRR